MKNASAIAERLEQDLDALMARLQALAGELRQHIQHIGPRDRVDDLHRIGRELSVHLKRLRDSNSH